MGLTLSLFIIAADTGWPGAAPSMPYGDANAIVIEMASEVLTIVKDTPVLAGVCGTVFLSSETPGCFLKQVAEAGFSGVQNFPTVGLINGSLPL